MRFTCSFLAAAEALGDAEAFALWLPSAHVDALARVGAQVRARLDEVEGGGPPVEGAPSVFPGESKEAGRLESQGKIIERHERELGELTARLARLETLTLPLRTQSPAE